MSSSRTLSPTGVAHHGRTVAALCRALDLRHDRQRPTVRILEEGHPFLGAVIVSMDHVRRIDELDPASLQLFMGLLDIGYAEIKYRLRRRQLVSLGQQKPRTTAIEECQFAERVEMAKTKGPAVPKLRDPNVPDRARYLADVLEPEVGHWSSPLPMQCAAFRRSKPLTQHLAIGQTELAEHVLDVEFDRILADTLAFRYLPARHAVLNRMRDLPLRGSEKIVVRRPSPSLIAAHPPDASA